MSKRAEAVAAEACIARGGSHRQLEAYPNRELTLGALTLARAHSPLLGADGRVPARNAPTSRSIGRSSMPCS